MQNFSKHILNEKARNLKEELEDAINVELNKLKTYAYVNELYNVADSERPIKLEISIDLDASTEIEDVQEAINKTTDYILKTYKVDKSIAGAGVNRIFLTYHLDRAEFENSNIYKSCTAIQKFDL